MKKIYIFGGLFLVIIAAAIFVFTNNSSATPSVAVSDQKDMNGEVVIAEVISGKAGWLVIQTNEDGAPGPVIGYTKINPGVNRDVKVKVDVPNATPTLHAMIHEDDGVKEKFDFPENDLPIMYKMEMVTKIFRLN